MVVRLEDARALKRMNAPLNTPVEEREFSPACKTRWDGLMDAQGAFMIALHEYVARGSLGKWRKLKRKLMTLDRAATRCVEFASSQEENPERGLMIYFLHSRAVPFILYWAGAIDAVDAGAELTINPGDIPKWFDERLL
jgi:hypothetical protein